METKFTKGKWIMVKTAKYFEPKSSTVEIHSDNNIGWICKIQNNGVIEREEGNANAKLIAAAPEMFEAIVELQKKISLVSTGYPPVDKELDEWRSKVNLLIKKATE